MGLRSRPAAEFHRTASGVSRHPELRERTIWEMFEAERSSLVHYAGRFDGFHAVPASVSKTCLVRFDNNRYSVSAHAVGRPVEIRAYADRIELRQDGRLVKIGARIVRHGRPIIFRMTEVMVPRGLFQTILGAITALRPLPPPRC
jgi:hypothetical protein